MAGLCAPLSTLRRHPRGGQRMTRGQRGSLLLHCSGLPPPTPCRFYRRTTFVHLLSSYLPASHGRFLQQSLTTMAFWATAALPGLKPASARRLRGACPHLLYSTGNPIRRLPVHVAPSRILADTCRRVTE